MVMDYKTAEMILTFLALTSQLIAAETHSLQYFYTAVRGVHCPEFTVVGLVDGEQIVYYDSNIRTLSTKTEWMKKVDDPDYLIRETERMQDDEDDFKVLLTTMMERFNQTGGVHTLQQMYGCELDNNGTIRGYDRYGYDGEDFLDLNLETLTWNAANHHAVVLKDRHRWGNGYKRDQKFYLENECMHWLKKFVSYGRETLERKDRPEASVHKHFPQPELVCQATGFFPSDLMMSWQKDGEEMHEDVEITTTVPNQDGTFQKRAALRVSPEKLRKHEYTCVVQHSSLEKDLVLKAPDVGGGSLVIIVGAGVAVLALVALIAGVLIWKKKNSGFRPVPAKPNSSWESVSENTDSSSKSSSTSSNGSDISLMKELDPTTGTRSRS
ncbi:class I histocompatibility antigen, Non-RT1.A alpha-1 chain-like [Trichomycterus rosablanca]|uniref:class I histocompatibility antigen, Non-RT1.A alpha-1 chain-like n=1 Tax=Trichomycterus rosablanca TaxID=2290929 RepID=UPI002F3535BA